MLDSESHAALIEQLRASGWVIEGDFIYAPRRTMWLLVAQPWTGSLRDMLAAMRGRLERLGRVADTVEAGAEDDTAQLVRVLEALDQH